jgi:hypothetical protein
MVPPDPQQDGAAAAIAGQMMDERDHYRAALLWALSSERCASGEVLLRAALGELGPGMHREPPAMEDLTRLVRLLRTMPWAREGFLALGRDNEAWKVAGNVLCEAAGFPDPWLWGRS